MFFLGDGRDNELCDHASLRGCLKADWIRLAVHLPIQSFHEPNDLAEGLLQRSVHERQRHSRFAPNHHHRHSGIPCLRSHIDTYPPELATMSSTTSKKSTQKIVREPYVPSKLSKGVVAVPRTVTAHHAGMSFVSSSLICTMQANAQ